MNKKEALAKIQRLSFVEKLAMLSETDTAYLADCVEKAEQSNCKSVSAVENKKLKHNIDKKS
ncbi:MAG: hypothetical protein LBH44_09385 [Treponema sp.]|nr:hypothetical protein [Treponema sp.]